MSSIRLWSPSRRGVWHVARLVAGAVIAVSLATPCLAARKKTADEADSAAAPGEERDALRQEVAQTQERYRELVAQLEQRVAEAGKRLDNLRNEKTSMLGEIEAAQAEAAQLRVRREECRLELEERRVEVAAMEQDLGEHERLMQALEQKLTGLGGKVATYEQTVEREQLLRARDGEIEQLRARMEALQQDRQKLAAESGATLKALQAELDKQTAASRGLEAARQDLGGRAATLEAALRREQEARRQEGERAAQFEQQLAMARSELGRSTKEMSALQESENKLRQALRGSEFALADTVHKFETQKNMAEQMSKDHSAAVSQSSELAAGLAKANQEREVLKAALNERDNELTKVRGALARAEQDKKSAMADARASLALVESLLSKHEELLDAFERMRENISIPRTIRDGQE